MKTFVLRILSILIFSIGIVFGLSLLFAATWADVESVFYGFYRLGNQNTTALHCPVVITTEEKGEITLVYKNKTDQLIRPSVRFQVSSPSVFRNEKANLSLEPGESQEITWEVSKSDLALDQFIFAKIFSYASYPQKDVEQTCGILVLDLPNLTGQQILIITIIVSLVGMLVGGGLWALANKPLKFRALDAMRAMITLACLVVVGFLSVLFAWWPLGVLLAALALIMTGVIIGHFFQTAKP